MIVGRPIVNEYNLDINTCVYVGGHYLKSFESKYENILTDNLSLIKLLEYKWVLFTVEFKNLYSYISVKYSLGLMKRWLWNTKNVIPNEHLIIEVIELVLNNAVIKSQKVLFKHKLDFVIGTNLAHICMAGWKEKINNHLYKNKNI